LSYLWQKILHKNGLGSTQRKGKALKIFYIFKQSRYSVKKSPIERFLPKIKINDNGCWEWTDGTNHHGYGGFNVNNKAILSHRFIYEYYHGMICPDLTIDHLCRNRKCVNPLHLEQVSMKINNERGMSPSGINSRKTHCIRGHQFTEENTIKGKGRRRCKICTVVSNRLSKQTNRIKNNATNRKLYHLTKNNINQRRRELYHLKRLPKEVLP